MAFMAKFHWSFKLHVSESLQMCLLSPSEIQPLGHLIGYESLTLMEIKYYEPQHAKRVLTYK